MPQTQNIDKFFDAVDDAYNVLMDTLKAGTDRGHRVSKSLIEQTQKGQQEALKLAHTIATSPTDLAKASGAVVETLTQTQGRVLEVSRQWLDETLDRQQEGREALRRLIDANRQAGEATIEASRRVFGRARERAGEAVRSGSGGDRARGGRGETRPRRKAQREKAETD
jgi:hypothetical protein